MPHQRRLTISIFNEARRWSLPQPLVDRIAHAGGDNLDTVAVKSRGELADALPETDFLVGLPPLDDHNFQRDGRLRWIQLTGSLGDMETSLLPALRSGVRVCTAASIRAPQVAEHALALALALVRRLDIAATNQADQRWATEPIAGAARTLRHATAGIVAQGSVAHEIATRLRAMGAHVLATRRDPSRPVESADETLPTEQLPELLARSNIVISATPLTPATERLIGKPQFAQMRRDALFIDVGHGGVVQQSALIDALRRGRIAGAGLDVFESEPLAPNSPLWTLPNVLITPHVASAGPAYWSDATAIICENLTRLLADRPLIDEVNEQWYSPINHR